MPLKFLDCHNTITKNFKNTIKEYLTRDLGFYIKNDLSMNDHIDYIIANVTRKMHSINKKLLVSDPQILTKVYKTFIRPNFEYGSQLFNIPQKKIINYLEKTQRTFTRIIFKILTGIYANYSNSKIQLVRKNTVSGNTIILKKHHHNKKL